MTLQLPEAPPSAFPSVELMTVTWSITPSSSSVPLQGKLPLPPLAS